MLHASAEAEHAGLDAAVLFVVARADCHAFRPCHEACPLFAAVLKRAAARGVRVLAHDVRWTETGVCYAGRPLPVDVASGGTVDEAWLADVLDAAAVFKDGRPPPGWAPSSAFLNTRQPPRRRPRAAGKRARGADGGERDGGDSAAGADAPRKAPARRRARKASGAEADAPAAGTAADATDPPVEGGTKRRRKARAKAGDAAAEAGSGPPSGAAVPATSQDDKASSDGGARPLNATLSGGDGAPAAEDAVQAGMEPAACSRRQHKAAAGARAPPQSDATTRRRAEVAATGAERDAASGAAGVPTAGAASRGAGEGRGPQGALCSSPVSGDAAPRQGAAGAPCKHSTEAAAGLACGEGAEAPAAAARASGVPHVLPGAEGRPRRGRRARQQAADVAVCTAGDGDAAAARGVRSSPVALRSTAIRKASSAQLADMGRRSAALQAVRRERTAAPRRMLRSNSSGRANDRV